MKKDLIVFDTPPYVESCASVVGRHEHEGLLGECFDIHGDDDRFGMSTWEKAEEEMQRMALNTALAKAKLKSEDLDAIFAGDLINQCTCSAQGLLTADVPFFGIYGACSTAAEGLILASMLVDAGHFSRAAVVTSSHNCSSERQFRFPLEYGGQRTPTSQWTVTGAGAFIVSSAGGAVRITEALPGKTVDMGVCDANNMGAAMAPAAYDTLSRYFKQSGNAPDDFDMIITGDLGAEGISILSEMCAEHGMNCSGKLYDCGVHIYDIKGQDMHSGGSGCGCFASVTASYIIPRIAKGEMKSVLAMATGALMSPLSVQQGESIIGIAHLLRIDGTVK